MPLCLDNICTGVLTSFLSIANTTCAKDIASRCSPTVSHRLSSVDASPSRRWLPYSRCQASTSSHVTRNINRVDSDTLRLSKRGRNEWSAAEYSHANGVRLCKASTHAQDFGTVSGVGFHAVAAFMTVTSHATGALVAVHAFLPAIRTSPVKTLPYTSFLTTYDFEEIT